MLKCLLCLLFKNIQSLSLAFFCYIRQTKGLSFLVKVLPLSYSREIVPNIHFVVNLLLWKWLTFQWVMSQVPVSCFGQLKKRSPKINTLSSDLKQMGVRGSKRSCFYKIPRDHHLKMNCDHVLQLHQIKTKKYTFRVSWEWWKLWLEIISV